MCCITSDCRKSSKFFFSVGHGIYFGQGRTELEKKAFQYDALDILRDIKQITAYQVKFTLSDFFSSVL